MQFYRVVKTLTEVHVYMKLYTKSTTLNLFYCSKGQKD